MSRQSPFRAARLVLSLATVALIALPVWLTQARAQTPALSLELNAAKPIGAGCRLIYVARNDTATALDKTAFEVAVFDAAGGVAQLLILNFGALPVGKTRVVQFDLAERPCSDISRLLVNSVSECTAAGAPFEGCLAVLATTTRTEIAFGI